MARPKLGLIVAVAALAWSALAAAPATAAAVFSVSGVAVDVTAVDAATAKAKAVAEAQRRALDRLLRRLALASEQARLPAVDTLDAASLVRAYEVDEEKVAPNRYIASLTVQFEPDAVRRLLRGLGIAFAETASEPVVVVPVFQSAQGLLLWQDDNPWRAAWAALPAADGLVPFVVPLGELADLVIVDAAVAAGGDREALSKLAERYDAGSTLVAEATVARDPAAGTITVRVTTRHFVAEGVEVGGGTYSGAAADGLAPLLTTAARTTRAALEKAWKAEHVLRFDREERLQVDIPLGGFDDWLAVRHRLAGLALIRRFDVTALNVRFARVVLHFLGDVRQLAGALGYEGLALSREDDLWVLRLKAADGEARVGAVGSQ